jgi:hypothetical protein
VANRYAAAVGIGRVTVVSMDSSSLLPYAAVGADSDRLVLVSASGALSAGTATWVRGHAVTSAGLVGPPAVLASTVLAALIPAVAA